ncbi:hypothetical protein ACIGGF_24060 [Rhodococcus sp. NPDC078407]|uniref:hypothetical protein n=1 Tax=Rhodococcus sp. NPDC078407 TaxID=3364509 RepID=UPI0037CC887E
MTDAAGQPPEVATNDQGRLEKKFGEAAGLSDNVTGEPAITFTISNPRMSNTCSGFWKFEPNNGIFLMVDINVQTSPAYATAAVGARNSSVASLMDYSLNPSAWDATNPDGTVNGDLVSTAALNCDESNTDAFSGQLAPASTYSGSYAFDVVPGSQNIFLGPPRSGIGWEWDLPADLLSPGAGPGDGAHRKCSTSLSESAHPVAVITVAVDGSR